MILFLLILFSLSFIRCDPIELSDIIMHEDTPIGHLLVKFNTTINEQNSYRFVSNNHREIQRYFSLNSSTGELRIDTNINRQLICTQRHIQCKFILKIFELFHEKLYHIPIIIEDIRDFRPIFPYKSSQIEFHLSENSPIYQSKLFIQQIYNHDQKQLKYQLKNIDKNFPFILEINIDLSNRLALVLTQSLDRETTDSYNCTLYVTDTNGHDEQLQIKINIDDVNDQSPIFESEKYSIELSENTLINTTILRVHAYDGDIGLNGQIIYDFTDASKQFNNIFFINNETGVIHLRSSLDYEQHSSYIFYIEARDLGKEIRSSQTLINITILDENDNYPIINFRFLSEMNYNPSENVIKISENYPIDKFFSQILVTDEDSNLNGKVRLWFESNDTSFNLYQINNSTYFLNCTKSFDFEYQQFYQLNFFAEDFNPKNPLQTKKILIIHILDENDNSPKFLHPFYYLSLNENNQINIILAKIEAYDLDNGENGRLTYEILTNQSSFPFSIDSNTGILRCLQSFDRENRSYYKFNVLARDHGYPLSLSSKISVEIDIQDINDNKPIFEYEKYEFSIEENFNPMKSFGIIRAFDRDLNSKLIYRIENEENFQINSKGEIYFQNSIDREIKSKYNFIVTVSDNYFKTFVPIYIEILDINDCKPQWKNPMKNQTKLILNKDLISIGTMIIKLEAIDQDDISNGNGFVSYSIEDKYQFLDLLNNGELILNSTPILGHYLLEIQAKDHGKSIQYSSMIQINLLIGDNKTNGSLYSDNILRINSLSTIKRVILLSTFFLSITFILIFIICIILIMICRYRKQKYLYYIKCNKHNSNRPKMVIVDSNSDSSKLSLEDIHQKCLIDHSSSSPSYTGTNIYIQHHQIASIIKPTQTTSDYYSNSSKDIDEWNDGQQQQSTEWSIDKILYPNWLYKDTTLTTGRKILNISTFTDNNSCQINGSIMNSPRNGKQTISSNSQLSPKQVRFGCEEQIRSYSHLSTTIRQLRRGTTTTISNDETHNTLI